MVPKHRILPETVAMENRQPENKYTPKQGQYLAFIHFYTKFNGYPPAEADMQKYFRTSAPSVHDMIVRLEKKDFIEKKSTPRSIRLLLLSERELPDLE